MCAIICLAGGFTRRSLQPIAIAGVKHGLLILAAPCTTSSEASAPAWSSLDGSIARTAPKHVEQSNNGWDSQCSPSNHGQLLPHDSAASLGCLLGSDAVMACEETDQLVRTCFQDSSLADDGQAASCCRCLGSCSLHAPPACLGYNSCSIHAGGVGTTNGQAPLEVHCLSYCDSAWRQVATSGPMPGSVAGAAVTVVDRPGGPAWMVCPHSPYDCDSGRQGPAPGISAACGGAHDQDTLLDRAIMPAPVAERMLPLHLFEIDLQTATSQCHAMRSSGQEGVPVHPAIGRYETALDL